MEDITSVTRLLRRLADGDREALHELLPLVYEELRLIARRQRRRHARPSQTLNTTALVHEAFLRLSKDDEPSYENRSHFMAVASTAMRQLLVDEARRHLAEKRGGGVRPLQLDEGLVSIDRLSEQAESLLSLDRALDQLGESRPRWRQVVECRFFGGLTDEETAEALGVADRTVRRDWVKARAWLQVQLNG